MKSLHISSVAMRLVLCSIFTVLPHALAAPALEVELVLSPAETLPAVPVTMRLRIRNTGSAPIALGGRVHVTVTDDSGHSRDQTIAIPEQIWAGPLSDRSIKLAPGEMVERLAPVTRFLDEAELFFGADAGLWNAGAYQVKVTVWDANSEIHGSATAPLTVTLFNAEDAVVWAELTEGGSRPIAAETFLGRGWDVVDRHKESEFYRRLNPWMLTPDRKNADSYAEAMLEAVQGLPGAYVDSARLAIVMAYIEQANNISERDSVEGGAVSAQARTYVQQLIDTPASPFGPAFGAGLKRRLKTAAEWDQYYRRGTPASPKGDVRPIIECASDNGDGTFTYHFGYESHSKVNVSMQAGSHLNTFSPAPADRGQPALFLPGIHHDVLTITDAPEGLIWTIAGSVGDPNLRPPDDCGTTLFIDPQAGSNE